ncbi:hypothetical protein C8R47DRAFT_422444 [Mycena vitilis]|nr:hypothetical protein C8R47DRAFT_422444 [Mycena vitilis]
MCACERRIGGRTKSYEYDSLMRHVMSTTGYGKSPSFLGRPLILHLSTTTTLHPSPLPLLRRGVLHPLSSFFLRQLSPRTVYLLTRTRPRSATRTTRATLVNFASERHRSDGHCLLQSDDGNAKRRLPRAFVAAAGGGWVSIVRNGVGSVGKEEELALLELLKQPNGTLTPRQDTSLPLCRAPHLCYRLIAGVGVIPVSCSALHD